MIWLCAEIEVLEKSRAADDVIGPCSQERMRGGAGGCGIGWYCNRAKKVPALKGLALGFRR